MNARNSAARRIWSHLTPYGHLELAEGRNGAFRILEDRGARNEHRRTSGHDARGVVRLDPTVDFQIRRELAAVQRLADRPYLAERALDELLPAKPGMDAHHEGEVQRAKMRQDRLDRRLRIQRQPRPDTAGADGRERSGHVLRSL